VPARCTDRAKLWRWRYRFGGKEKMMALGEYPLVTLKKHGTVTWKREGF
jgi:hypothetical protein